MTLLKDCASRELIYRNDEGNEVTRLPFPPQQARSEAPERVLLARCRMKRRRLAPPFS